MQEEGVFENVKREVHALSYVPKFNEQRVNDSFLSIFEHLKRKGVDLDVLRSFDKPMIGICLGMQILSSLGFEYGKTQGLGIINAEVKPVQCSAKVPHMGFGKIQVVADNKILRGIEEEEFYFMHSYEVVNYTNITSLTEYGGHSFVSSIKKDNIYGTQFHPEKSREAGIKLFANFINL